MSRADEKPNKNGLICDDSPTLHSRQSVSKRSEPLPTNGGEPVAGEIHPDIPKGVYEAVCYKTSRGRSWGNTESNYINFRICGGLYDGTELFMACPHYSPYKERHKYFEQWVIAAGRRPKSGEQLARKIFPGRMYRIEVRSTKRRFSDGTLKP